MPIYEYQCRKCGAFEVTQRITDPPLQRCPECRSKVTKLISQTSFQLKGSGWYVTDYASRGRSERESSEPAESSPSKTDASSEDKSSKDKKDTGKKESKAAPASVA